VTGGAINIKTKAPGKEQSNKVSASYGTFDSQKYNFSSKGPLSDGFSYSMAVRRALSDGYLNNSSGADNTSETWHGALKFYVDKGNGTKISFGANFETHELGAQPIVKRNPSDFYSRSTDFDEYTEIDRNQQFLTVENELGDSRFFSVTNRNDWSMNPNRLDLDMSTFSISTSVILQDHIEWTQELRLESEEDSELDWVLGAFYADSEIKGDATRWFLTGYPFPADQDTQTTRFTLDSKNIALFSSIGKDFSDKDYVSLGLRYDKFDKEMQRSKTSLLMAIPPVLGSNDFSSFSPSIQWEHSFSDELSGNARVTYAEKPGGFSAYADDAAKSSFVEEETMAFELSILFSPSASWGVNLTAYLNDIENYQFELPDPMSTDYYVDNADEVTAKGIEIEGFVKPAESVTLSVAYGLCDSEYDKFTGSGLAGQQVSFVPKQTLALSAIYQLDNGVYGQIGTKTIGDTHYWNYEGTNATDKIDSYTLLDANIGYVFNSWEVSVFGLNLTDEEYYTSKVPNLKAFTGALPAGGPAPGIAGSPRVIGLSVSREF
jgi:iron complex outermembrane receptor protein